MHTRPQQLSFGRVQTYAMILIRRTALLITCLLLFASPAAPRAAAAVAAPRMTVSYTHDWVGVTAAPNQAVSVTVADKAVITGFTDENGSFASHEWSWDPGQPDIEPGDTVTGFVDGTTMAIDPVGVIIGAADYAGDAVSGTVDASWFDPETLTIRCEAYSEDDLNFVTVNNVAANGGDYTCDFGAVGWDLQAQQTVAAYYLQPDGHEVFTIVEAPPAPWMRVNYGHDWVGGDYAAGHSFTITVKDAADAVKATAEVDSMANGGWNGDGFQTEPDDWQPGQPDIQPGDSVSFSADDGYLAMIQVGEIVSDADFENDSVSGTIDAPWLSPALLNVRCNIWEEGAPDGVEMVAVAADGGSYSCDFTTIGWDLQADQTLAISYEEPDGHQVINNPPAPWMRVNYGHDWVGGDYAAGHSFTITVKDAADAVKATAEVDSMANGGWNGDGFQTEPDDWQPGQPDIQPGDSVSFSADDGYTNVLRVGEIGGMVDLDADSVSGSVVAAWFDTTLAVECHPWGGWPGPAELQFSTAEPDGSVPYACNWQGEWDVQPGQNIAVFYLVPGTRDVVGNVFSGVATRYVAATGADSDSNGDNLCLNPAAPCLTLQHALDAATSGDMIQVAAGVYSENASIHHDGLTIRGGYAVNGAMWTADGGETRVEGVENESILRISAQKITLEALTFTGGQNDGNGGAISVRDGSSVVMSRLIIHGNAAAAGGGVEITGDSTVQIVDSAIYDNEADPYNAGGLLVENSQVELVRTQISNNRSANSDAGGIYTNDMLEIINSTLVNNSAARGGAIVNAGGTLSIANSTLVDNEADVAGGIMNDGGMLNLTAVLIADNGANGDCVTNGGSLAARYTLMTGVDDTACGLPAANPDADGNIIGQDAQLGVFGNHGGATLTYALLSESPAVDAIPKNDAVMAAGAQAVNLVCGGLVPDVDQRGVTRPQGDGCDIGSFELEEGPLAVTVSWFLATQSEELVHFGWQTAGESGIAGFNILAVSAAGKTALNPTLIPSPAVDTLALTNYRFRATTDATRFFLQEVSLDGHAVEHGPFDLDVEYGAYGLPNADQLTERVWLPLIALEWE